MHSCIIELGTFFLSLSLKNIVRTNKISSVRAHTPEGHDVEPSHDPRVLVVKNVFLDDQLGLDVWRRQKPHEEVHDDSSNENLVWAHVCVEGHVVQQQEGENGEGTAKREPPQGDPCELCS